MRIIWLAPAAAAALAVGGWALVALDDDPSTDTTPPPPPATRPQPPPTPVPSQTPSPDLPDRPTPQLTTLSPGNPTATPRGGLDPSEVDTGDIEAVAEACAATLYTYDTTIDTSPRDAARRAQWCVTDQLADVLTKGAVNTSLTWDDWSRRDAWADVTTSVVRDQAVELGYPHLVIVRVTVTMRGRDGWTSDPTSRVLGLVMTNQTGGWLTDKVLSL